MTDNQKFKISEYDALIKEVLETDGQFRLYPRGTSMLPLIRQGTDSVSLVKAKGNLSKNDIAFYQRDSGEYVLHRVVKSQNGIYTMCGDNQLILEEGIENRHIIGVVKKIYRDKKSIENTIIYKMYLLLWQSFFIRRAFFFLRRVKNKLTK